MSWEALQAAASRHAASHKNWTHWRRLAEQAERERDASELALRKAMWEWFESEYMK